MFLFTCAFCGKQVLSGPNAGGIYVLLPSRSGASFHTPIFESLAGDQSELPSGEKNGEVELPGLAAEKPSIHSGNLESK